MTLTLPQALRSLGLVALMGAWAVGAHLGSAGQGNPDLNAALGVAPLVAFGGLLLRRAGHPLWVAGGVLLLAAALVWLWPMLRQNVALLYFVQHVGINLAFAALFGKSLVGPGEALVTRLARILYQQGLSERKRRYTRGVTLAWALFFCANATASTLLYVLTPAAVWSFYANLLTAPLVGVMFVAEHLWRIRALPPEERPSMADVIRVWRLRTSRGS